MQVEPRCLRVLVVAVGSLLACRQTRQSTPGGRGDGGTGQSIPRVSKVRPLVLRLASKDQEQVSAGRAELLTWKGPKAPSTSAAIELLRASGGAFPTDEADDPLGGIPAAIIEQVAQTPRPEYRPVIEEVFPRLNRSARESALRLLSVIDDDAAAASFVRLLTAHAGEMSNMFSLNRLQVNPHHADVFFPRLLDLTRHDAIADELYLTALAFCQKGKLTAEKLAPRAPALLAAYRAERDWLLPRQKARGVAWMWSDDYQVHRQKASILLDLAGCLPLKEVENHLIHALAYRDPRLVCFALTSLATHDQDLPAAAVATVAASAEMRNFLYDKLDDHGLTDLIPARYRTQAALAESNMVGWLVYPTELGQVPDQIELKKVVSVDTESPDGMLDYYLFRFRGAKQGWMAGVSGPFLRKEAPTTNAQGDTFSDFEPWKSKTPDEHLGDVRELLEEWRKRRATASEDDEG